MSVVGIVIVGGAGYLMGRKSTRPYVLNRDRVRFGEEIKKTMTDIIRSKLYTWCLGYDPNAPKSRNVGYKPPWAFDRDPTEEI